MKILVSASDFNLEATLDSGQVFGFQKITAGTFQGIIAGRSAQIAQAKDRLWVSSKTNISERAVRKFFDLDRDLKPLYKLLEQDAPLKACQKFKGLRIIQQDPWEALAGFIISSNNNIKRIQKIWKSLSLHFCGSDALFPKPQKIAKGSEQLLRDLGLGYRAPFLLKTAKDVFRYPERFDWIQKADYEKSKELILKYSGVGPKVADCVLLFGFQKYEAFPVDTWITKAMRKLYFRGRKVSEDKAASFARKRWGPWAGYVQQYLFHTARIGHLPFTD